MLVNHVPNPKTSLNNRGVVEPLSQIPTRSTLRVAERALMVAILYTPGSDGGNEALRQERTKLSTERQIAARGCARGRICGNRGSRRHSIGILSINDTNNG